MRKPNEKEWLYAWSISIRGRLFLTITVITLLAFCCVIVFTSLVTSKNIEQNVIEFGVLTANADVSALSVYLEYARKSIVSLYYNVSLYNIIRSDQLSLQDEKDIQNFLRAAIDISGGTERIRLNLYQSDVSITLGKSGFHRTDGCSPLAIPDGVRPFAVWLEPPHTLTDHYQSAVQSNDGSQVFSLHWNIYNLTGERIFGTLSLDMSIESLETLLSIQQHACQVFLIDDQNHMIYASGNSSIETVYEALSVCKDSGSAVLKTDDFDGYAFTASTGIPGSTWYIVELLSRSQAYEGFHVVTLIIAVTLLVFLASTASVLYIIEVAVRPLLQIRQYAADAIGKHFDISIHDYTDYQRPDEIGAVIQVLDEMMQTIQEMFERQKQLHYAHRTVETKMLLSQINPHFLYNTLQSIGATALQKGERDLYKQISMLGASMHYSMDLNSEVVSLSDDANHARYYLELQNVRFSGRIISDFKITADAGACFVPKMILQPIVGNSFKHGRINEQAFGYVSVRASVRDGLLDILVGDNGKGMEASELAVLNEALRTASVSNIKIHEHIGLLNIMYRLRLLYGSNASMSAARSELGGMEIRITLPLCDYMETKLFVPADESRKEPHESADH